MPTRSPVIRDRRVSGSYAAAGVDIDAGERAVALMRDAVGRTLRPEVVGGIGGFAGLFDLSTLLTRYARPLLASSTDGVGTKIAIARELDRHDTVGIDLVAMVVDDLVCCGAEPLFLLDYIACGSVVPQRIATIVSGIAAGCEQAGCALIGGETAEHPGLMARDDYDLAATGIGVVDADAVLGPERVRAGDAVIAMAASGLHANGFSLVRHVLRGADPLPLAWAGLGDPLGEVLLTPTRIYARDCLALIEAVEVHALCHVTGGGLAANLARVLPAGLGARLERGTWTLPPVMGLVAERGRVPRAELERTFNVGVGMVAVVAPAAVNRAIDVLGARGVSAWQLGHIGRGPVELVGDYRAG